MSFNLLIVTPYRKYLETSADSLSVFTTAGELTILPGHVDFIGNVEICPVTIVKDGALKKYAAGNGAINVDQRNNLVTLILSSIESVEEIDMERALESKRIAEQLVIDAKTKKEIEKAEIKLKKAINRINLKERDGI